MQQTFEFIPSVITARGEGMSFAYTSGDTYWSQHQLPSGRVVYFQWKTNPYQNSSPDNSQQSPTNS
jgi:hypothetical protein